MVDALNIDTNLAASAAGVVAPAQKAEDPQVTTQKSQLQDLIRQIRASGIPLEKQEELIRDIESALSTGSAVSVANILNNVRTEASIAFAEDAADAILNNYLSEEQTFESCNITRQEYLNLVRRSVPDYDDYSPESKAYIDQQSIEGLQASPELQKLVRETQAMPAEVRKKAETEQTNNYRKQKELLANPEHAEFKDSLEEMKRSGLLKGKDGARLLEKIERHEITPDELKHEIAQIKTQQNDHVSPIVHQLVDGLKDKEAKNYIKSTFSKPDGSLDVAAMRDAWEKIPTQERDDAIQAYLAGKATPEQKSIALLSKVAFSTEMAVAEQGLMSIMQRDKDFAKQMTNLELSDEQREQLAAQKLREEGYGVSRTTLGIVTEQFVDAVNTTQKYGIAYGAESYVAALRSNLMEEFQPSHDKGSLITSVRQYDQLLANKAETFALPEDVLRAYAAEKASESVAPDYIKRDPGRYAAWQKEQAEWETLARYTQEAKDLAEAQAPINPTPAAPKTPEQLASEQAQLMAENPYAALMADPANMQALLAANKVAQENNIVAGAPPEGDLQAQTTPQTQVAQAKGGPAV